MSVGFFAAVLISTGVMRLVESAVSIRGVRRRPEAVVAEPVLFAAMVLLHVCLILAPLVEVLLLGRKFVPLGFTVALAALFLATALRIWTLKTLGRAWNVRIVTPEDHAVVTHGPYAWIRHPNYLVVIVEVAALPLLHNAWVSCLVLSFWNGVVLAFRIRNEERALMRLPAWRDAMARRPRLIPGLL